MWKYKLDHLEFPKRLNNFEILCLQETQCGPTNTQIRSVPGYCIIPFHRKISGGFKIFECGGGGGGGGGGRSVLLIKRGIRKGIEVVDSLDGDGIWIRLIDLNNNITFIHEREKTIDEMQVKVDEIEHLDGMEKMFHQLESKLENLIERKLDEKMVTINKVKDSIVQEVKSNNDCFEQKLDNVIQNNKSFVQASASSGSPLVPDFRSIMNEAKNQELIEEYDKNDTRIKHHYPWIT